MLNVPLPWFSLVYPPNEPPEPDLWCNRAELTEVVALADEPLLFPRPLAVLPLDARALYGFAIGVPYHRYSPAFGKLISLSSAGTPVNGVRPCVRSRRSTVHRPQPSPTLVPPSFVG